MLAAAGACRVLEFADAWPDGLQTVVCEGVRGCSAPSVAAERARVLEPRDGT